MYANSGYLHNTRVPIKDKSKPLIVGSCGTYRLKTTARLPTWRPRGRLDYQLLYVASGKGHFFLNGNEEIIPAGYMVLYQPRQEQHYEYHGQDQPEVYWVHFTGNDVKGILKHFDIPMDKSVFFAGVSSAYRTLFKEMIRELQNCRTGYQELLEMYLRQLFLLIQRTRQENTPTINTYLQKEMEQAQQYFQEHCNEDVQIKDYAKSRGMSVSWFLRSFKEFTGQPPAQYLLALRMNNAVSLLETTDYNVAEISAIVGYDNALYFSRLFKKHKGVSPSEYRKLLQKKGSPHRDVHNKD